MSNEVHAGDLATSTAPSAGQLREQIAVMWTSGGSHERIALLAFVIVIVAIFLGCAAMVLYHPPFAVLMSYILAVTPIGAILDSISTPIYNERVLREGLRRGWWKNDSASAAYFEEMARFLEAHGDHGLAPGAFLWALLNWGIYYLMWGVAVLLSITLLGIFGNWTPFLFAALALPVFLSLYALDGRRVKALYREAERYGFHLEELSPSMQRFRARQAKRAERKATGSSEGAK